MPPDTNDTMTLDGWFQGEMNKALFKTGANSFRNDFLILGNKLEFD